MCAVTMVTIIYIHHKRVICQLMLVVGEDLNLGHFLFDFAEIVVVCNSGGNVISLSTEGQNDICVK